MKKRVLSILLAAVMVFSLLPIAAFATDLETLLDSEVYISISDDAEFITAPNGTPMGFFAVPLEELLLIDLADYDLEGYTYDADGDNIPEITALHLYIYVHEIVLGLNWSDVYVTGGPGSIYFAGGLFGFSDENLRYDLNGAYPAVDGWGLTADQIVLSNGDFLNVAHYTSWAFWGDSATGFHYFTDEDGNINHTYSVTADNSLNLGLVRSYSDWSNGGAPAFAPEAYYEVYYGQTYGNAEGTLSTDDNGMVNITLPSEGTWYVWADGGFGEYYPMDVVSAPGFATIIVEPDADALAANEVITKISAIGTVTSESKNAIESARAAYDALTDTQKALVDNYSVLVEAEKALAVINTDIEKSNEVKELINAIGTVSVHSYNKINAVRAAYNALTDSQKQYVDNYNVLTAAEAKIAELYVEAAKADHKAIYEATGKYLSALGTPTVGSVGGEWMVIDLVRAGYSCPEGYYENVVEYVKSKINANEQLHRSKSTDNSRVILALTASGYDVADVDGHNLLMGLTDMNYVKKQGINGPIWALIALDCYDYEIPTNANAADQVTRDKLISYILEKQFEDGGWALSGTKADPDITGMAIQSLAPYYSTNVTVKAAVDKALDCLSEMQYENGGFGSIDGTCSESCAQVVVALTALGINPETDARFVKNGVSVLDAMCVFAVEGGGFAHIPNSGLNGMATEQSQYALASYFRMLEGKTSLYDMTDVQIGEDEIEPPQMGDNPQTGFNSHIFFYSVLLISSVLCVGIVVIKRKEI